MELDELKTKWHELDGRLSCADTKIDRLTAEVSAGKITSAKQRLARTIRLGIFLLAALPLCFANLNLYPIPFFDHSPATKSATDESGRR